MRRWSSQNIASPLRALLGELEEVSQHASSVELITSIDAEPRWTVAFHRVEGLLRPSSACMRGRVIQLKI